MNGTLKRAAVACMAMFALLMINVNYFQAVRGQTDTFQNDNRDRRNYFERYAIERGRITAGGKVILAQSKEQDGSIRFVRRYAEGELYAHVTGFFSPYTATQIEGTENKLLDGSSADLLLQRGIDMFTGEPTRGANVDLTIDPKVQKAAYDALRQSGKRGAVVAIDPKSGAILAMVSLPTYDPNVLSDPDPGKVTKAYEALDPKSLDTPLLNRTTERTYAPGSTFKVVTTAAWLEEDSSRDGNTNVDAPTRLSLPSTSATLPNYGGAACGGGNVPMAYALQKSCNTPYGKIGLELGYEKMLEQTEKFGIGQSLQVPIPVVASSLGPQEDPAAIAMSAIGQRSVQMTPLQMAMIAAGIANDGKVMKPYLVNRITNHKGDELSAADPEELSEAMSAESAQKLKAMMVSVVNEGTARAAQVPGLEVGGKTGTAETAKGRAPHAWFIGFSDKVALAVLVESGAASVGAEATGGGVAAPIAKSVLEAVQSR
ncbi:peptidoglycan D,D-transpeptidase FtsI family protein [Nonomuraea sp. NPDC050663]|uniref:peptidoglycan D,D-transpeptidase FtsI family protein n=1 Tax=Nonomuraea sp. NPDC050663 TaxID=3364370 RepID=UPI0037A88564